MSEKSILGEKTNDVTSRLNFIKCHSFFCHESVNIFVRNAYLLPVLHTSINMFTFLVSLGRTDSLAAVACKKQNKL